MPASSAKRDAILAAARALASRHGQDGFTVLDVSREAQVSHTTVYNHFEGRQHMLEALAVDWNRSVVDAAADHAVELHPSDVLAALEAFVIDMASRKHAMLLTDARLFEAYRSVLDGKPGLREPYLLHIHRFVFDRLREGEARGEIEIQHGEDVARAIVILTAKFRHAVFIAKEPLVALEGQIKIAFRHVFRPLLQSRRNHAPTAGLQIA
jgi:AcrR family transcriptional regulator